MKKIVFLSFLLLQAGLLFSQEYEIKAPPGTIKLNDSTYIDKAPVTNLMIVEFIDYFQNGTDTRAGFPGFPFTLEDIGLHSSFETPFATFDEPSWKGYASHPEFWDYPALNLTRDQAELFCRWRSGMVNQLYWIKSVTGEEKGRYASEILYRLPTEEEYRLAVDHFREKGKLKITEEVSPLELKPKKRTRNRFFIYNISEYTAEDGVTGTNWREEPPSGSPNDYTGFRCICEIRE